MAVEIPANAASIYFLGRIGRRITLSLFTILAGLAGFLMIPFMFIDNAEVVVTVFALLGKAFITVSYSSVYVATAEIYPTCVRGVGLGISASFARLSGMGASFVGGYLSDVWRPLPALIFGVFGVVSGGLVVLLPETMKRKLPDTIAETEQFANRRRTKDKFTNQMDAANRKDLLTKDDEKMVCLFADPIPRENTNESMMNDDEKLSSFIVAPLNGSVDDSCIPVRV